MSDDHDPAAGFGPRPQLPQRPPVPDDRIHGDTLDATGERSWPGPQEAAAAPGPESLGPRAETLGAPTPAPAPRLSRSPAGRRNRRRLVVLGAGALLLIGGLNVGRDVGSVEQHSTLTHAVTGIRLNGGAGDVEVSGGARAGTVELTRRLPQGSDPSSSPGETWEGSTLVVDADTGCGPLVFGCSVDYTLHVPDGTAVTVDDGSGNLKLAGTLGIVDVKTGSGDIKANGLQSAAVAARSGSGDIDLGLSQAPNQLTVDTGSGDVDVTVPSAGTYAVGVQTGSGDHAVTVNTDANSPHKVQIKTGSGDVKLGYR